MDEYFSLIGDLDHIINPGSLLCEIQSAALTTVPHSCGNTHTHTYIYIHIGSVRSSLSGAPEVIRGDAYIGPEVDCWSLGVCLFAILAGRLPFQHLDDECKRKQIRSGEYSIPAFISPEARDLLQRILVVNSSQRMTIPEMRQHNWLRSCSQPSGA